MLVGHVCWITMLSKLQVDNGVFLESVGFVERVECVAATRAASLDFSGSGGACSSTSPLNVRQDPLAQAPGLRGGAFVVSALGAFSVCLLLLAEHNIHVKTACSGLHSQTCSCCQSTLIF